MEAIFWVLIYLILNTWETSKANQINSVHWEAPATLVAAALIMVGLFFTKHQTPDSQSLTRTEKLFSFLYGTGYEGSSFIELITFTLIGLLPVYLFQKKLTETLLTCRYQEMIRYYTPFTWLRRQYRKELEYFLTYSLTCTIVAIFVIIN